MLCVIRVTLNIIHFFLQRLSAHKNNVSTSSSFSSSCFPLWAISHLWIYVKSGRYIPRTLGFIRNNNKTMKEGEKSAVKTKRKRQRQNIFLPISIGSIFFLRLACRWSRIYWKIVPSCPGRKLHERNINS